MSNNEFETISQDALATVAGAKSTTDQLTTMLTQISSSIKDLATAKPQSDPMQMMMMMMMMGGSGGGSAQAVAAPPAAPAAPNVINVNVAGGYGRRRGRKGW